MSAAAAVGNNDILKLSGKLTDEGTSFLSASSECQLSNFKFNGKIIIKNPARGGLLRDQCGQNIPGPMIQQWRGQKICWNIIYYEPLSQYDADSSLGEKIIG